MHDIALFDRLEGGAQGLCDDLSTVDATPRIDGADADEDVGAVRFEGHEGLEIGDVEGHAETISCFAGAVPEKRRLAPSCPVVSHKIELGLRVQPL